MADVLRVIEIAKGSRNKYEWSPEHKRFVLDRFLSSSVVSRSTTASPRTPTAATATL